MYGQSGLIVVDPEHRSAIANQLAYAAQEAPPGRRHPGPAQLLTSLLLFTPPTTFGVLPDVTIDELALELSFRQTSATTGCWRTRPWHAQLERAQPGPLRCRGALGTVQASTNHGIMGAQMNRKICFGAVGLVMFTSLAIANPVEARGQHVKEVRLEDRCDPATFNAAPPDGLGEGTCVPLKKRGGTVTLQDVFEQLNPIDFGPDKWRFSRDDFSIKEGDIIRATNTGGEGHSFTEVPEFGGGCVPEINEPLGLTVVTANCPADFATVQAPGQSRDISGLAPGEHKFICVIHPWMRATVEVKSDN